MSEFSILDKKTPIHNRYLIEASAGTGKTFSIENLFVRLILEKDPSLERPLLIDEIAAVTFTNAATEELKRRIKGKIAATASEVELFLESEVPSKTPYLQELLKEGKALDLLQLLKTALFSIEDAQIFTIHSFCYKLLKEHYYVDKAAALLLDQNEAEKIAQEAIQDYFQSDLPGITPAQARLLITDFGGEEKMKSILLRAMQDPKDILAPLPGKELMKKLQQEYEKSYALIAPFSEEERKKCLDLLYKRRKQDRSIKDKTIATHHLYKLVNQPIFLDQDFERLVTDGVPFFSYFKELYAKPLEAHPIENTLLSYLKILHAWIEEARAPSKILAVVISEVRKLFFNKLKKNHQLTFDTLLQKTALAAQKKAFVARVRKQLKAVIVDEFQDTDPVQWSIFRKLFIGEANVPPYLYLVGDPKQSIYAFRSADIYTYLQAYKDLGEGAVRTLGTNWRSSSTLVEGINHLFSEATAPNFLHLPATGQRLLCPPVKSGQGPLSFPCKERKAVHFFCKDFQRERYKPSFFESEFLSSAIIEELLLLHKKTVSWEQIAILAKDRAQLYEVKKWLNAACIPYSDRAGRNAMQPFAIEELLAYARALASPKKIGVLKRALAGPLFGFDEEKLESLEKLEFLGKIIQEFSSQRSKVNEHGFAKALYSLMRHIPSFCSISPWERLHQLPENEELREDISHLIDSLLIEKARAFTLEEAIETLEELYQNPPAVKIQRQEGVQLITLHSSKGLEWDVVFALAHLRTHTLADPFVSVSKMGKQSMQAAEEGEEETSLHFQEKDAEKARLFYVLMTRAKHRLYIPLAYNFKQESSPGQKSMQELWLEASSSFFDPLPLFQHPSISYQMLYPSCIVPKPYPKTAIADYTPHFLNFPSQLITSFSSLTANNPHHLSALQPPQEMACPDKTVHTLPGGAALGTIVHTILENALFNGSNTYSITCEVVKPSLFSGWEEPIEKMVTNTLKADLGGFSFKDIDPSKVWREVEFSFSASSCIERQVFEGDQIKGFIDLLFFHKERWYIVDWKTNWLGPNEEHYSSKKMAEEMEKHRYFLQASLYKNALANYLRQYGKQADISCIYLFVRGCKPCTQEGVYFVPDQGDLT